MADKLITTRIKQLSTSDLYSLIAYNYMKNETTATNLENCDIPHKKGNKMMDEMELRYGRILEMEKEIERRLDNIFE